MIYKYVLLSAIFAAGASAQHDRILQRLPRQTHGKGGQQDQSSAETGFLGGGGVENSKYFQDIYVLRPDPMEIEFGHVFENPREWEQRYEKKDFNKNRHQGKVRWADKKGGHGEHYWDYNHAGHGGNGNGGNGVHGDGDRNGGYSDPVPVYTPLQKSAKNHQKRQLDSEKKVNLEDVEPSSQEEERKSFVENLEKEIGGVEKYDIQKETAKQKRNSSFGSSERQLTDASHLFFDLKTGEVVDDLTGKKYILQPVN